MSFDFKLTFNRSHYNPIYLFIYFQQKGVQSNFLTHAEWLEDITSCLKLENIRLSFQHSKGKLRNTWETFLPFLKVTFSNTQLLNNRFTFFFHLFIFFSALFFYWSSYYLLSACSGFHKHWQRKIVGCVRLCCICTIFFSLIVTWILWLCPSFSFHLHMYLHISCNTDELLFPVITLL